MEGVHASRKALIPFVISFPHRYTIYALSVHPYSVTIVLRPYSAPRLALKIGLTTSALACTRLTKK